MIGCFLTKKEINNHESIFKLEEDRKRKLKLNGRFRKKMKACNFQTNKKLYVKII